MKLVPYINLNGRAEQALNFYQTVFGGESQIMRWGEMPPDPHMPVNNDWRDKVMHATLAISEDVAVYLADSYTEPNADYKNNVFIHIEFDSEQALRAAWDALSVDATINMPVDKTFWGAVYGDLIDKFGIGWGFHFQLPK